jgi:hypothetical protein
MNTKLSARLLFAAAALCALSACRSVDTGPGTTPEPGQQGVIYGKEPAHAPIPQKDVPEGESSLRKTGPDERIDKPKS